MSTSAKPASKEITIDANSRIKLKNRDLIDYKRTTGVNFVTAMKELDEKREDADWELFVALLWIVGRRDNPDFTYEDALDSDIGSDMMDVVKGMIADPTAPADTSKTS